MIKDNLVCYLQTALLSLGIKKEKKEIQVDIQTNSMFGDYSTNIAFTCNQKPSELAEKIKNQILKEKYKSIDSIKIAGEGFINFYLNESAFIKKQKTQSINKNKNKQVLVEYTDPNPFKIFHIGHLMTNVIGEAIASLYEASGYTVKRICYQGDIGPHVAKTLWGVCKKEIKTKDLSIENLALCYTYANKEEKNNDSAKNEIQEINKRLYKKTLSQKYNNIYRIGREISLSHFEKLYKVLGTKFDNYFFETEVYKDGMKITMENINNGIFEKSDGAVVYRGEKKKLNTRVFITSKTTPTYEAKELGLYFKKIKAYPKAQFSIIVTANEQQNFFKVVNQAIEEITDGKKIETLNITHGIMKIKGIGKMSSREGNIVSGEDLIKRVIKKVSEKNPKLNKHDIETIAISAIKVGILRQEFIKDIHFNIDQEISLTGDSGPYLLYSLVRCKKLLSKKSIFGLNEKLYKVLGTKFDNYFFETEVVVDIAQDNNGEIFFHHILIKLFIRSIEEKMINTRVFF